MHKRVVVAACMQQPVPQALSFSLARRKVDLAVARAQALVVSTRNQGERGRVYLGRLGEEWQGHGVDTG